MEKIYFGADVLTMDKKGSAEAVLVENGLIKAVGSFDDLKNAAPYAEKTDLGGGCLLPAFIDGHSHLAMAAAMSLLTDLRGSRTAGEIAARFRSALAANSYSEERWLIGTGYDESEMSDLGPTRQALDEVSRDIPIVAMHISGHICTANTRALELFGYTGDFTVPEGGSVSPEGRVCENAFMSKAALVKGAGVEETLKAVGKMCRTYEACGFATIQEARAEQKDIRLLEAADAAGLLSSDVAAYMTLETALKLPPEKEYTGHLRRAGVKTFLDGSIQGHTAWLKKPYKGSASTGIGTMSDEELLRIVNICESRGWQLNVHVNGDMALEQLIRAYESIGGSSLRPVAIHCQLPDREQLARMKKTGLLPSFFLDHVYYWGDYHYEEVLGAERAERIDPLFDAEQAGLTFTVHRDTPVLPPASLESVQTAVLRRTKKGRILGAGERVSTYTALKALTCWAAVQICEEDRKGSISPGKQAAFVLLDKNPLYEKPEHLAGIRIKSLLRG